MERMKNEEIITKINAALGYLRNGESITIEKLRLENDTENFNVIGWSEFINFENLTKSQSLKDLEEVKEVFSRIANVSEEFRNFVKDKTIVYNLYFDDAGKASIAICSEKDGLVKWHINIER